ncbi:MFS transporter [Sansalvadorimonas sp. 2012CJ34-2]|uniref:MFS transporter n=1 Tax=Parendozoicomonas callyspongiae TaxID=2942213 RepID=A0ABT0PJ99_9GAMM|nr:MFS transporter [Sansalvadorimonas sp. 2012CJ34-2]MCL6271424.1 MFS transporter [Sansalvadorimonas sp. 2012CJ34-2]
MAGQNHLSPSKVVAIVSLGGFLELYDFIIYAMMAGYLADHFFPAGDQAVSLLLTFSTFSVGYLARPLGGAVFGHIGDRYGRKRTFALSVLMMAASTLTISVLPGYSQLGVLAPVMLTILRLVQGFSLGGEVPGAITYLRETQKHPGLAGGALFMALMLGVAGASMVHNLLLVMLGQQQVAEWGWRLAFALGGSLGIVSYYIRRRFRESPVFQALFEGQKRTQIPLVELVSSRGKSLVAGVMVMAMAGAVATVLLIFGPGYYIRMLGYPSSEVSFAIAVASVAASPACLLGGWLCEHVSRNHLLLILGMALGAVSVPMFHLWVSGGSIWLVAIPASLMGALFTGVIPVLLGGLFPARFRYTGVGLSYNLGMTIFGGLSPPLIMFLVGQTGDLSIPGYYLTGVAGLGLCGVIMLSGRGRLTNHKMAHRAIS